MREPRNWETPRLRLELLEERHAGLLYDGLRDETLYEFIAEPPPADAAALAARYRRLEARRSPDGRDAWLNWAMLRTPGLEAIGWLQATVRPDATADVAYVLCRDAWGYGYAREAVAGLLLHLRDEWGTVLARATVDVRNRRSIALLEALCFARGAVRHGAEVIRGVATDDVAYTLLLD